jgi:hypothetical protein
MLDFILVWSLFVKLLFLFVAGFAGFKFLAYLDWRAGWSFKDRVNGLTFPQAVYFGLRIVAVALVVSVVAGCSQQPEMAQEPPADPDSPRAAAPPVVAVPVVPVEPPRAAGKFPAKYDAAIRKAVETYGCAPDWRLLKAQYWQESRLDPLARSPAGAEGIAQFMPGTARDIFPLLGHQAIDRKVAEPSIDAGCYYMTRLRKAWSSPRPDGDRHRLALASYNAGLGHILNSQKACGGPLLYDPIMACLPQITGHHAKETLSYAPLIYRWFAQMVV